MMPQLITIQTAAPKGDFAGRVAQAYFVVKGKQVALTDSAGNTLHDPEGRECVQEPIGTDTPRETAAKLLKRFRTKLRGDRPSGFDQPLRYPPLKY